MAHRLQRQGVGVGRREREEAKVRRWDLKVVSCYTNLKQWKLFWKKTFGRHIVFPWVKVIRTEISKGVLGGWL
jgi:hypothetical protein